MVAASSAAPPVDRDTVSVSVPMHRRIAIRLKHAALKAARPARRGVVRALRHHAVRARRSVRSFDHQAPTGLLRSWLRALVAVLRTRRAARRFSLRAPSAACKQRKRASYTRRRIGGRAGSRPAPDGSRSPRVESAVTERYRTGCTHPSPDPVPATGLACRPR